MPTGALGRLLDLARQLCAIQRSLRPQTEPAAIFIMAGYQGIAAEGVSAYPQEVTGQMAANFLRGGAAINILARRQKARVVVVDMGIKQPPTLSHPEFIADKSIGRGTANFLHVPAMTTRQAEEAIAAGRRVVAERMADVRVLALGEMGIGNTTSASALTAVLTEQAAGAVTGRGTGVSDEAYRHKIAIVDQAVTRHFPDRSMGVTPLAALTAVGGFEIAGLVGAALEAADRRMVIVLDGFISTVAGLIACRLEPNVRDYCVAAHRSVEKGHQIVLDALELNPLLDLGLRLGEGSGAALALNLIACAGDIMRDMATFESAGVSNNV
jgi:nicotinate-nucleotide--dimethylbenzimidazole phosphoribosyltransferase